MSIFEVASIIGSVAFATSGFLVGIRKNLDLMGIFIVSMITANGGGTIRDLLVNKTPGVLSDERAFILVILVITFGIILKLHKKRDIENKKLFILSDALGLASFGITGALVAVESGLGIFGVMVLAFITATGGGIIRDIMVNEVPAILSSGFYGTIAISQGILIYALSEFSMNNEFNIAIIFILTLLIRIIAYWRNWRLPRIKI